MLTNGQTRNAWKQSGPSGGLRAVVSDNEGGRAVMLVSRTVQVGDIRVGAEDHTVLRPDQRADPLKVGPLVASQRPEGADLQAPGHAVAAAQVGVVLEA